MTKHILQVTQAGYENLVQELDELKKTKRPKAVIRIQKAREFGDLSENSEYHSAREDLDFLDSRIQELEEILQHTRIVIYHSNKTVGLGSKVLVSANSHEQEFSLVGEWEANPMEKKISIDSPLGKALLGKKPGDQVEVTAPAGKVTYQIKKIN